MRLPSSMKRQPIPRIMLSCIRPESATSAVTNGSSDSSGADVRPAANSISSSSSASRKSLMTRIVSVERSSLDSSALEIMEFNVDLMLPTLPLSIIILSNSTSGFARSSWEALIKPGPVAVIWVTACNRIRLALGLTRSSPFSSTKTVRNNRSEPSALSA